MQLCPHCASPLVPGLGCCLARAKAIAAAHKPSQYVPPTKGKARPGTANQTAGPVRTSKPVPKGYWPWAVAPPIPTAPALPVRKGAQGYKPNTVTPLRTHGTPAYVAASQWYYNNGKA